MTEEDPENMEQKLETKYFDLSEGRRF